MRQIEHRIVEAVEAGQRDELEFVPHRTELALELGYRVVVEVLLPVERRRTVVRKHLARVLGVESVGKSLGEFEIRLAGLAPQQVRVRRVGEPACHSLLETVPGPVEAFDGALAGTERLVVVVDVGGHQVRRLGIGTRQDDRRHTHGVGSEPRGDKLLHRFARGHQHLASHVAALLDGGQLVFEVNAGRARFDHRLHQLECVEHAAEPRFCVGDDGREVVNGSTAFHVLDLVGAHECVIDPLHYRGHRVDRVQ